MNFNFFDWIQYAVKTSVLRGVGDAVNELGMPAEESSKEKILGFLKNHTDHEAPIRRITGGAAPAGSKKLGRSLSDIAVKEAS